MRKRKSVTAADPFDTVLQPFVAGEVGIIIADRSAARIRQRLLRWMKGGGKATGLALIHEGDKSIALLWQGLSFDLQLAPRSIDFDVVDRLLDFEGKAHESHLLSLAPGEHIVAASRTLPVIMAGIALATRLAEGLSGSGVFWEPARLITGIRHAVQLVDEWEAGGALPVPMLTSLHVRGTTGLRSNGLKFACEQEIELIDATRHTTSDAAHIMMQLAHWQLENGPVKTRRMVDVPAFGLSFELTPVAGFLRARVDSRMTRAAA